MGLRHHGHVEFAVAVEISDRQGGWRDARNRIGHGRLKSSVSISQQHRYNAAAAAR